MVDPALTRALNAILDSYGSPTRVENTDLGPIGNLVTDAFYGNPAISRLLTSLVSEPIRDGCFYHYTSGPAAKSICASKVLRLTSITKRLNEGEIREFLEGFDYKFPLQNDPSSGVPNFHSSIAPRLFYVSFTETNASKDAERYFWDTFARKDGARLKFHLHLDSGVLRRISYGETLNRACQLFQQIKELISSFGYEGFFWNEAGMICAIYLPVEFQRENEIRLIASKASGLAGGSDAGFEYLELPFGFNTRLALKMELIEVQTNRSDLGAFGVPLIPRC
jgi:hypothetical protein